jgi:UDP-N-acetyl-D-mannosaminuronate dehydrogenase
MTANASIAERLQRHAVVVIECTIPPDMTCEEWRRWRSARVRPLPREHVHERVPGPSSAGRTGDLD